MPKTKIINNHKELAMGFLAGILGGVLTWFATDYLSIKKDLVLLSTLTVDGIESRQGKESLRWDFTLQPEKRYMFSPTNVIGGFLHLEVQPDKEGRIKGLNLSEYNEISFYAKASSEVFFVNEFNLFIGSNYIQYTQSTDKTFFLSTKWTEYRIAFNEFSIAPWEQAYRSHLIDKNYLNVPNIKNVSAIGFDLKTTDETLSGRIWIDYLRLIDKKGSEIILSDGSNNNLNYLNQPLRWVTGAREYP